MKMRRIPMTSPRWRAALDVLWELDPAGVSDRRAEDPTEYDELVRLVLYQFAAGADRKLVEQKLRAELANNWGVSFFRGQLDETMTDLYEASQLGLEE